jgi:hypothetical protein
MRRVVSFSIIFLQKLVLFLHNGTGTFTDRPRAGMAGHVGTHALQNTALKADPSVFSSWIRSQPAGFFTPGTQGRLLFFR